MGVIATETWEWVFFGMPWQWFALIAVIGTLAIIVNTLGSDD